MSELIHKFIQRVRGKGMGAFFVRKASTAFIMNGVATAVGLVTQVVLARTLDSVAYGDYIYVFSWLNILALLGSVGMNNTLLKHVASYRANEQWGELHGILRFANAAPLAVSIVIAVVTAGVIWGLKGRISHSLIYTFWIGCLLIPVYSLTQIRQSALRAQLYVVRSTLPEKIIKPILLMGGALAVFFWAPLWVSASVAMALDGAAIVVSFFIGVIWLRKLTPKHIWQCRPIYEMKTWLDLSVPFLFLSSISLIMNKSSIILIGYFIDTKNAGIFAVAASIAQFISFSLQSVTTIITPLVSELYTKRKINELEKIAQIAAVGIFSFSIPIAVWIIVFGKNILSIFGNDFIIAYPALILLIVGQVIKSLSGFSIVIMCMTGKHKISTVIMFFGMVTNIISNIMLIPLIGIVGASISFIITVIFTDLAMSFWLIKKMKINVTIINKELIKNLITMQSRIN